NSDFTRTAHYDLRCLIIFVSCINYSNSFEFKYTTKLRLDVCFNSDVRSSTTHVESTKCQLSSRLTDGLCSNYAYCITCLCHVTCRQVTSITFCTTTNL